MNEAGCEDKEVLESMGATSRASWPFGGDHVMQATKAYPERERELIRWLFFHSIDEDVSLGEASENVGYEKTTIYRVLKGDYGAGLSKVADAIEHYKKLCEQRSDIVQPEFVETTLAKRIWKICDAALVYNTIALVYGDPQTGKTWSLQKYAVDNNHGTCKYVRMPATAGVQLMMKEIATACAISRDSSFETIRFRVMKALDKNNLLIVDEIHQSFVTYHKQARLSCLELLREIHDRTRCGIVLCGTNVFRDELQEGEHRKLLDQLRKRGIFKLQLPATCPKRDLDAIAAFYKLSPAEGEAEELVTRIVKDLGLKAYTSYLSAASRHAAKEKAKLTWDHVIQAHDIIAKLSAREG